MKHRLVTLLVLLLFSQPGQAGVPEWFYQSIKVDNPNQLAYCTKAAASCPVTTTDVEEIIEGVFIRSRVKPLKLTEFEPENIYLEVSLSCFEQNENHFVYDFSIHFSRALPYPSVKFNWDFGYLGIGNDTAITIAIKGRVEDAITEYIKVNFDL